MHKLGELVNLCQNGQTTWHGKRRQKLAKLVQRVKMLKLSLNGNIAQHAQTGWKV